MTKVLPALDKRFRLEEATIDELHAAIQAGETTCVAVVQALHRARARLQRRGERARHRGRRAGCAGNAARCAPERRCASRPQTVKASTFLPDLDKYKGPPLEFGRMEATASDPGVQQQFGMIVGIPMPAR